MKTVNEADAGGKARLSPLGSAPNRRNTLINTVSNAAIGLSIGLACVGVVGLIGWGSPLAKAGTLFLVGVTVLTEIAAAEMPASIEEHARERDVAGVLKALLAGGAFAAFTAWNLFAGHLGATEIERAGLNDLRAPLQAEALRTEAALVTAQEALAAFDVAAEKEADRLAGAAAGAMAAGYVTSAGRAQSTAAQARMEQRRPLAEAVATARAADAVADQALAHAPTGRPWWELWAPAIVLEILKGALRWLTTRRRFNPAAAPGLGVEAAQLATLDDDARAALKKRCASLLASLRHLEARAA